MTSPPLIVVALGFVLGMRHALDADHLVAVSSILARGAGVRRAALVGAVWGLGHSLTILLVGGAIVLLQLAVPPRVALGLEALVALMLVALGVLNVAERPHVPAAPARRPLVVGMVHGLAGSAAVALLVAAAVPDGRWALAYLALFGLGTIAGMAGVTTLVGWPVTAVSRRWWRDDTALWQRRIAVAAGVLSLAFGAWLAWELIEAGLFGAEPRWDPH